MITAAAHTFPHLQACVTSLPGQCDAPVRQTVVTCSNAIQVTIYNCRKSGSYWVAGGNQGIPLSVRVTPGGRYGPVHALDGAERETGEEVRERFAGGGPTGGAAAARRRPRETGPGGLRACRHFDKAG